MTKNKKKETKVLTKQQREELEKNVIKFYQMMDENFDFVFPIFVQELTRQEIDKILYNYHKQNNLPYSTRTNFNKRDVHSVLVPSGFFLHMKEYVAKKEKKYKMCDYLQDFLEDKIPDFPYIPDLSRPARFTISDKKMRDINFTSAISVANAILDKIIENNELNGDDTMNYKIKKRLPMREKCCKCGKLITDKVSHEKIDERKYAHILPCDYYDDKGERKKETMK